MTQRVKWTSTIKQADAKEYQPETPKIIKKDVIERFTLKLNNKAFGENFIVFVLIKTNKEIKKTFFSDKHVKEVFGITGEFDLMMKLKFKDIEEFNDFLIKFRKENEIVSSLTMVSTLTIKEEI